MKVISKPNIELTPPINSQPTQSQDGKSFSDVFEKEMNGVKLSAHAQTRMKERQIQLTDHDFQLINKAVDRADQKGARESLFLLNDLALLVNIKNRTVITAVDQESQSEKIFTNIDSAVIVEK